MRAHLTGFLRAATTACAVLASAPAWAAPYFYVDWTSANVAGGTASGVITLPDASTVTVTFASITAAGGPGQLFFAQTNGGTNYWNPSTPYISAQVSNAPPGTDILALVGGVNQTYRVTLSAAIKDPIMAVLSLGQPSVFTTYDFDSPFDIVSQGTGFWGGGPSSLVELPGDILRGNEGHGTLQFLGTFSTFSWTVPTPEQWHGFTFGIRTTTAIEPEPPTGASEPATLALFGAALLGCAAASRRKRA
ncbi:MAG TPA: PEP-CTERM sorting domain-containing protein [Burkholderiaceae bacterium]|nr:PEP-CTERM sorting domain-containing protein [Burkholderiaceae bacterium]